MIFVFFFRIFAKKNSKMKRFNLAKAKQGDEVCTKDGKAAKILLFDRTGRDFPLVAIIDNKTVYYYSEKGKFYMDRDSEKDLKMV